MCVICVAAKKRHIKEAEVLQAMKANSAGFFMAALHPDGKRDTIRTLDQGEAVKFFEDKVGEDDAFVMHARIPSRGETNLANVHGWEYDGILYMHNMTISSIDDMMRRADWKGTDSEFFFRKIFIPYYRELGEEAYKDGKLHPDLDNIVQHFCGTSNKFCFVMPDNKVLRYGNWMSEPDRKEGDEIAFWASNTSYKVFEPAWPEKSRAGFARPYGGGYDSCDWDDYYEWRYGDDAPPKPEKGTGDSPFDGKLLMSLSGEEGVCRLALTQFVLENVIESRGQYAEEENDTGARDALTSLMPKAFTRDTLDAVLDGMPWLSDNDDTYPPGECVTQFAEEAAAAYEEALCKAYAPLAKEPTRFVLESALEDVNEKVETMLRLLNVGLDFDTTDPERFAAAYVMTRSRDNPLPVMTKMNLSDVYYMDDLEYQSTEEAVRMMLIAINDSWDELVEEHPKRGKKGGKR